MQFRGLVAGSFAVSCALAAPVAAKPGIEVAAVEPASAPEASTVTAVTAGTPAREAKHAFYVEALGKGGLWGVGYDYQLTHRFAAGAVASYYVLGGDQYLTFSPYVVAYPVRGEHHGWFVHAGPQVVHRATPSPVPEWNGMSTTSVSAELSSGYEYRRGVLVRIYAMGAIGDRFVPGVGVSLGWSR